MKKAIRPSKAHRWISTKRVILPDGTFEVDEGYWYDGSVAEAHTGVIIAIEHWQWKADDDTATNLHEVGTLLGSEDTSFEITLDESLLLIAHIENTGDSSAGSATFQLEYNVGGAGWNTVDASSSNVRTAAGRDNDNSSGSTERLTATTETFNGSLYDEIEGNVFQTVAAHEAREWYYSVVFRSAELSGGETVELRLVDASGPPVVWTNNTNAIEATVPSGAGGALIEPPLLHSFAVTRATNY